MIGTPEKISILSHSTRKGSLGLPASSPQRSLGLPASRKVCPKGFLFLARVGVSPGLSFYRFPFSLCINLRKKDAKNACFAGYFSPCCWVVLRLSLHRSFAIRWAQLFPGVILNLMPKVTRVGLNKLQVVRKLFLRVYLNWTMCVRTVGLNISKSPSKGKLIL